MSPRPALLGILLLLTLPTACSESGPTGPGDGVADESVTEYSQSLGPLTSPLRGAGWPSLPSAEHRTGALRRPICPLRVNDRPARAPRARGR